MIDIKFGRLKVIAFYNFRKMSDRLEPEWVCLCDCGNYKIATTRCLKQDKTKSCGCLQKEVASMNGRKRLKPETFVKRYFQNYKYSAKRRNIKWKLSFNDFKTLINKNCYLCNKKPEPKSLCRSKYYLKEIAFNGIDRIDNNLDYNLNNCKPCCTICNVIKGKLSRDEFVDHILDIVENLGWELK